MQPQNENPWLSTYFLPMSSHMRVVATWLPLLFFFLFLPNKLGTEPSTVHRIGSIQCLTNTSLANSRHKSMYLSIYFSSLPTYLSLCFCVFLSVCLSHFLLLYMHMMILFFYSLFSSLILPFSHWNLSSFLWVPTFKKGLMLFYLYDLSMYAWMCTTSRPAFCRRSEECVVSSITVVRASFQPPCG